MLAAINACGNSVSLIFVFPRVGVRDYMMRGARPGSIRVARSSRWMTAENFMIFIRHIAKSTRKTKDKPILLVIDNHDSNISVEVINVAKETGIVRQLGI